jgi:hypothetical protein
MNYADRNVLYSTDEEMRMAPVTRLGSGEYNGEQALEESRFWAYSVDDVQPAINLGFFVDIDQDLVLKRTIKVTNLISNDESFPLSMRAEFRDPAKGVSGVVRISFDTDTADLSTVGCQELISIVVTFSINTASLPANSLSS